MVRDRIARYRRRIRRELVAAFRAKHTPHQIAASFAIGIFVTTLPTGGLGVGLFFVFAALWSWVSKPAIFAAVAVLNPVVKPAVYVASFRLGGLVLGPWSIHSSEAGGVTSSARDAAQQLLVGNVLVAVSLSLASYVFLLYVTRKRRRHPQQRAGSSLRSLVFGPFQRR